MQETRGSVAVVAKIGRGQFGQGGGCFRQLGRLRRRQRVSHLEAAHTAMHVERQGMVIVRRVVLMRAAAVVQPNKLKKADIWRLLFVQLVVRKQRRQLANLVEEDAASEQIETKQEGQVTHNWPK